MCNKRLIPFVQSLHCIESGVTNLNAAEATRHLFDLYADMVYRFSFYILKDAEEAEDAVQEIFIKVLRSWDQFEERSDPKTWLLSITRNHLYDKLRKMKRDRLLLQTVADESRVQPDSPPVTDVEMEELLLDLKLPYRQVVILRYMQDMTTEEVARVMGWSKAKVRTTLHRAIQTLRRRSRGITKYGSLEHKAGEPNEI